MIFFKVQNFKSVLFIFQFQNIMIYSHAVNRALFKGHPVCQQEFSTCSILYLFYFCCLLDSINICLLEGVGYSPYYSCLCIVTPVFSKHQILTQLGGTKPSANFECVKILTLYLVIIVTQLLSKTLTPVEFG